MLSQTAARYFGPPFNLVTVFNDLTLAVLPLLDQTPITYHCSLLLFAIGEHPGPVAQLVRACA